MIVTVAQMGQFSPTLLDAKRTTVTVTGGIFAHTGAATLNGRIDGQQAVSATTGILNIAAGTTGTSVIQLDISNSGGYGIDVQNNSQVLLGLVVGNGNVKAGVRLDRRGCATIDVGATVTAITGTTGDFEFSRFTSPDLQTYATIRTADANGVKGYPSPASPTLAVYGNRCDA